MQFSSSALLGLTALLLLVATGCEDSSLGPDERGTIEGQVHDFETEEPLAGANVTTSPPTSAPVTDEDGRFTLDAVEAGNYTISAQKSGYGGGQVTVAVRADQVTQATLFLKPDGASGASDSLDVTVINWTNRVVQSDSVFVDVEYRVHNAGTTDVDAYEVYFRIETNAADFFYEAHGDSLAGGQSDIAQFSKYVRDHTATDVLVDGYWAE